MARSSAMHKIPLDGTTGTVYHPRATIELALTSKLTSMVARHTGDRDFTVQHKHKMAPLPMSADEHKQAQTQKFNDSYFTVD